ncbi:hypothetical protein [Ornithinimicrobium ciconiae]|uniref:hypothetical protein n=1 Tax=Ornithinimicrobium ciconiae TaxID=2594265 RepID=UPI00192D5909|nr:hypothetical protein [Ornithinimicrobium ciconiae]
MRKGEHMARREAGPRARAVGEMVRVERVERDLRLSRLGEIVAVLLGEQDALVSDHGRGAGAALRSMVEEEGVSARESLDWCGVEGRGYAGHPCGRRGARKWAGRDSTDPAASVSMCPASTSSVREQVHIAPMASGERCSR